MIDVRGYLSHTILLYDNYVLACLRLKIFFWKDIYLLYTFVTELMLRKNKNLKSDLMLFDDI